jgi:hypothetical protein
MDSTMSEVLAILRYFSAHVAAIGGIAGAIVLFATGNTAGAFTALLAALAGFGLPLPPAVQSKLTR